MRRPSPLPSLALALALWASLAGCAATRHRFAFDPAPASFVIEGRTQGEELARGLASILEGRRESADAPARLVVALMLENRGAEPLRVEGAQLLGSDLSEFEAPDLKGLEVAPGATGTWDLEFGYPAGLAFDLDAMSGLHLRLEVASQSRQAEVELGFARTFPVGESSSRWHFSFGVGVHS